MKNNKNNTIKQILNLAAVGLAIVSFYTTAEGLHEFVFEDKFWQALLISGAIQITLFVLNLKLGYYITGQKNWIALSLWVITLSASSFFSYVYISNQIYHDSLYYSDVDRIINEKLTAITLSTKEHLAESEAYNKEVLHAFSNTLLNTQVNTSKSLSSNGDTSAKSALEDCIKDIMDTDFDILTDNIVSFSIDNISDLLKNEDLNETSENVQTAIDVLNNQITILNNYKAGITTEKNNNQNQWEINSERLKQYSDFTDPEFVALQAANNELEMTIAEQFQDITEISVIVSHLKLCKENLTNIANDNSTYAIISSRENIMLEINKKELDTNILQTSMNDLHNALISQDLTSNAFEMTNYYACKDALNNYEKISKLTNENEELIGSLSDNSLVKFQSEAAAQNTYDIEQWKHSWKLTINSLQSIIREIPVPQKLSITSLQTDETTTIFPLQEPPQQFDQEYFLNELSSIERTYLEKLNNLEKAKNLICSKYNFMAIFSLITAVFLDALGAAIGLFIYYKISNVQKSEKASA